MYWQPDQDISALLLIAHTVFRLRLLTTMFLKRGRLLHHLTSLYSLLSAILARVWTRGSSSTSPGPPPEIAGGSPPPPPVWENHKCSTSMISWEMITTIIKLGHVFLINYIIIYMRHISPRFKYLVVEIRYCCQKASDTNWCCQILIYQSYFHHQIYISKYVCKYLDWDIFSINIASLVWSDTKVIFTFVWL